MNTRTARERQTSLEELHEEHRQRLAEHFADTGRCTCKAPIRQRQYRGVWTCAVCQKPMER